VAFEEKEALDLSEGWWDTLYGSMLMEDIRLGLMPIGGTDRFAKSFKVESASEYSAAALTRTISSRVFHARRGLAEAVSDWCVECATTTVAFEQADYALASQGNEHVSIVPANGHSRGHSKQQQGPLQAAASCVLPNEDSRQLRLLRSALRVLSDGLMLPGMMLQLGDDALKSSKRAPFDFATFERDRMHALARATAFIGWNARNSFHPAHGQNSYQFVRRELRFHRFKAVLRRHALSCLNECLRLAGEQTKTPMAVVVKGFPSEHDVDEAIAELEAGMTKFADLLNRFRL